MRPVLNFAHANGIPASTYNAVFRRLEGEMDIVRLEKFAHNDKYLVRWGWEELTDELIENLENHTSGPVIGVGHSFGAVITCQAAIKRPELFSGLILLDPVIANGWLGLIFDITRHLGVFHQVSPARRTRNRRRSWPDRESAEAYFRSKALFRHFDEECLKDYLDHGLQPCKGGLCLSFEVEKEVAIFSTGPTHVRSWKRKLKEMPGVIIAGEKTNVAMPGNVRLLARRQDMMQETIPGGHMFPLEKPAETAEIIRKYVRMFQR